MHAIFVGPLPSGLPWVFYIMIYWLHVCLCDAAAVLSFFPFVHVMSVVSSFDDLVQSGADPFLFLFYFFYFFQDSLRVVLIVLVFFFFSVAPVAAFTC